MDIIPPQRRKDIPPVPRPPRQTPREDSFHQKKSNNIVLLYSIGGIIAFVILAIVVIIMWFLIRSPQGTEIASPETPSPVETSVVEEENTFDFQLTLPEEWKDHSGSFPNVDAMFVGPEPQESSTGVEFTPNINVVRAAADGSKTLEAHIEESKQDLEESLQDFVLIDDAPVTTLEGQPAYIIGGTFMKDNVMIRIKQLHMFSLNKSYIFAVTASALAEYWDEENFNELYDAVLISFIPPLN